MIFQTTLFFGGFLYFSLGGSFHALQMAYVWLPGEAASIEQRAF